MFYRLDFNFSLKVASKMLQQSHFLLQLLGEVIYRMLLDNILLFRSFPLHIIELTIELKNIFMILGSRIENYLRGVIKEDPGPPIAQQVP